MKERSVSSKDAFTRRCPSGWMAAAALLIVMLLFGGCSIGPPVLKDSVLGYDETTADLELKMLLLNIARRDAGVPIHFTVASSIAATFDWTTSTGAGVDHTQADRKFWSSAFNFNLGFSASENPTFSIYPVAGEEFTERLLTPIKEELFNIVMFQDARFDETVRLLSSGIEIMNFEDGSYKRVISNDPKRPEEYKEFRQMISHMQWLHDKKQLFVRRLVFKEPLLEDFPDAPTPEDIIEAISEGLRWQEQPDGNYMLTRFTSGRLVVTNYDPLALEDRVRYELNERIKNKPDSFIHVDIAPEGPGGNFPIYGAIKMRSMVQIIDFVAAGTRRYPEFHVPKDPRTGELDQNPVYTLQINTTNEKPSLPTSSIKYNGKWYSVADTEWDRANFRLVAWLFQASVGEIQAPGLPITISK